MKKFIFSAATIIFISMASFAQETTNCHKKCDKKECSNSAGSCDKTKCKTTCKNDKKSIKKSKNCKSHESSPAVKEK